MVTHLLLQQYWWILVSILGSLFVVLTFVQGGQMVAGSLSSSEADKTVFLNALGRKWEFTFTTLVTFGGAFFASFPLFYATSFSGAYLVWISILFCFVVQAVSYEYRSKPGNIYGKRVYEGFLWFNGVFGSLLPGVAVATFFSGAPFSINDLNQSRWEGNWKGLEALADPMNLLLGLSLFFLARITGILYLMNSTADFGWHPKARKMLVSNGIPFLSAFLAFLAFLFTRDGFGYSIETGVVSMIPHKYLLNMIAMPAAGTLFVLGVAAVLAGLVMPFVQKSKPAIWFAGAGTFCTVFSLLLCAGLNQTAYYPSLADIGSSLTIVNSSSSYYTLMAMSWVSLLIPFVLVYIWFAWRSMNKTEVTHAELEQESHKY